MRKRSRDAKRSDVVLFATSDRDHVASVTKPFATSLMHTMCSQSVSKTVELKTNKKTIIQDVRKTEKNILSPHAELFLEMKVKMQRNL